MNRGSWLGNLKKRQALGKLSLKWKYNLKLYFKKYNVITRK
jgi:hypothetical protein